ncbi:hypothetical protein FE783_10340 [Paenibacillus mesophilus]|uniref:hypothetical protein n=1 Tax=Paenibacillus mesophilus TaxID=2582849 RepID=UPI00110D9627|nr:hypothetical protein [Paenibacillus mesophilus]TMV49964.1 hypothetical protein FE783_10340 [Paenibacillus mesophilus]
MSEPAFRKRERIPSVRITGGDSHTFYGYYDNPAFSGDDRYHLVQRVPFCDRLPKAGDRAEIGVIELESGIYTPLSETTAWNFQQGSMLQWNPASPDDEIIYNVTLNGQYRAAVLNLRTQAVRYLDRPVANIDPTGSNALSINFGRMFDFRPGYGYADIADPYRGELHPAEDGVYGIDLLSGRSKLVLSLDAIWSFIQPIYQAEEAKLTINHITFNTDGTRFLFLARWVPPHSKRHLTALLSANADGSGLRCISTDTVQSHYHWRDGSKFVMFGGGPQGNQLYEYEDSPAGQNVPDVIDASYFLKDGHCSYSPDRNWMLYDSYPDQDSVRHLYIYDLKSRKGMTLGSYYSPPSITGDIRCDLHPRWNRAGTMITFDSAHEGQRHVYAMDLRELLK